MYGVSQICFPNIVIIHKAPFVPHATLFDVLINVFSSSVYPAVLCGSYGRQNYPHAPGPRHVIGNDALETSQFRFSGCDLVHFILVQVCLTQVVYPCVNENNARPISLKALLQLFCHLVHYCPTLGYYPSHCASEECMILQVTNH